MKAYLIMILAGLALLAPRLDAGPQDRGQSQRGQQGGMHNEQQMREMHDQMHDEDMQQMRGRQGMMDREHMRDEHRAMFGHGLMSAEERAAFRQRLQEAGTEQERERLMAQHREEMMQRAREQGVDLGGEPVFGWQMMSRQERDQFMDRQRSMEQDRVDFLQRHRERMMDRAQQRDVSLEEEEDQDRP